MDNSGRFSRLDDAGRAVSCSATLAGLFPCMGPELQQRSVAELATGWCLVPPQEGTQDAEQIVDTRVPRIREEIVGVSSASASGGVHLSRAGGVPSASVSGGVLLTRASVASSTSASNGVHLIRCSGVSSASASGGNFLAAPALAVTYTSPAPVRQRSAQLWAPEEDYGSTCCRWACESNGFSTPHREERPRPHTARGVEQGATALTTSRFTVVCQLTHPLYIQTRILNVSGTPLHLPSREVDLSTEFFFHFFNNQALDF